MIRQFFYISFFLLFSCNNPLDEDLSVCGEIPFGSKISKFRIIQVLPNPVGPDDNGENFVIKNFDTASNDLYGWKIINSTGHKWYLNPLGQFAGCEQKTLITLEDNVLKNDGDTIRLYDKYENLIQTVSWGLVNEGEVIYINKGGP